jgi:large subunit ribosomal protein L35
MRQKLKTRKAASKRIKVTGTGKLKRYQSGGRHLLEHEAPGKKKNRKETLSISKADVKKVKKMLPGKA